MVNYVYTLENFEYFLIPAANYSSATTFCVLERGMTTSVSVLGTDLALEAAQAQLKTIRLTAGADIRKCCRVCGSCDQRGNYGTADWVCGKHL